MHELQVIDHDEAEAVLRLGPPRPTAKLRHGEAGRVVEVELALHQPGGCARDIPHGAAVKKPVACALEVQACLGADRSNHQLGAGHFHRKDQRRHGILHGRVEGYLHAKSRFAAGRASGDDDHLPAEETAGRAVQIMDACLQADGLASGVIHLLDMLYSGQHGVFAVRDGVFPCRGVSEGVECLLAAFLGILCGECKVVCRLGHGEGRLAHGTAFPHIQHLGSVVPPVHRDGEFLHQLSHIGIAAALIKLAYFF